MHIRKPNSALEETKCSSHSLRGCPKGIVVEWPQKLYVEEYKNLQILNIYNQYEIKTVLENVIQFFVHGHVIGILFDFNMRQEPG
jgi:hypothetical protein